MMVGKGEFGATATQKANQAAPVIGEKRNRCYRDP
jgi:hypothetical protein